MDHNRKSNTQNTRPLSAAQRSGIEMYQLSEQDVNAPNFGVHTLDTMNVLRAMGRASNHREAFEMVRGLDLNQNRRMVNDLIRAEAERQMEVLNPEQLIGYRDYGLNRAEVQAVNFGAHTLEGIQDLQRQAISRREPNLNNRQAFERIAGLDAPQVTGITEYDLNRRQVQAPNFGEHTVEGMRELNFQDRANDDQEAFEILEGLNAFRTRGITEYGLDREQVIAPTFNRINFDVMEQLRAANPEAQGQHLYEVARDMPEFQVRALTVNGLTIEQLGIGINGNEFVLNDPEGEGISGSVVDAHFHLKTVEGLSHEDALSIAQELDSTQTIGMIDSGLSLEQVTSPYFLAREEVLESLSETLQQLDVSEFPIEEGQRQLARETFDGMRSGAASMPVRVPGPNDSETDEERALGQGKPVKAPHEGQLEDDRKPAAKEDFGKKKEAPRASSGEDRKPMAKETPQQTNAVGIQGENTQQEGIQTSGEGVTDLQAFIRPRDVLDTFGESELSSGDTDRQEALSSEETRDQVAAVASIQDLARQPARRGNFTNKPLQRKEKSDKKKSKKPTP